LSNFYAILSDIIYNIRASEMIIFFPDFCLIPSAWT
jgi:hypothetical protein